MMSDDEDEAAAGDNLQQEVVLQADWDDRIETKSLNLFSEDEVRDGHPTTPSGVGKLQTGPGASGSTVHQQNALHEALQNITAVLEGLCERVESNPTGVEQKVF